jgi:hypothetical protein
VDRERRWNTENGAWDIGTGHRWDTGHGRDYPVSILCPMSSSDRRAPSSDANAGGRTLPSPPVSAYHPCWRPSP